MLIIDEVNRKPFDSPYLNLMGSASRFEEHRLSSACKAGALIEVQELDELSANLQMLQRQGEFVLDHFFSAFCQEKLYIIFSDTVCRFFMIDFKQVFRKSDTKNDLSTVVTNERTFDTVAQALRFKFLKSKVEGRSIVGFHVLPESIAIIVYSTGQIQQFKIQGFEEKIKPKVTDYQLKFPLLDGVYEEDIQIDSSFVTMLSFKKRLTPVLIVQFKSH